MKFLSRRGLFKAGAGAAIAGKEMIKANMSGTQGSFQPAVPPSGGQYYNRYGVNTAQVQPPNLIEQLDNANFVAARKQSLEAVARGEFSQAQLNQMSLSVNTNYIDPDRDLHALKSMSDCAKTVIRHKRGLARIKLQNQKSAKRELKRYYSERTKALLIPRSISEHLETLQKVLPGQDYDDDI